MIAKEINIADLKETNLQLQPDNVVKNKINATLTAPGGHCTETTDPSCG
ncbi:hypothetical protein [Francisella sp. SYW-9]|nr:hypothetical protein [Francisella sp. SYW-9]